jgi:hypothetical protein
MAWAMWQSRAFAYQAGLFPRAIGLPLLALGLVQLAREVAGREPAPMAETEPETPPGVARRRTAGIFGWIVGYPVTLWLLGFTLGGPVCMLLTLGCWSRERWPLTLALTAGTWVFVHGLFDRVLRMPFPPAQLGLWLWG